MNFKKFLILGTIVIVVVSTVLLVLNKNKESEIIGIQNDIVQEFSRCFMYEQRATEDAPYAVSERLRLDFINNIVSGKKSGTQTGPGMSNGYSGDIDGFVKGDTIEAVFSYIVEGSQNSEREVYKISEKELIKLRYELEESEGMLVPKLDNLVSEQKYQEISC